MHLPPGFRGTPGALIQLSSGRLLCALGEWLLTQWNNVDVKVIGRRDGHALWDPDNKTVYKGRIYVIRSDDEGQTWQGTDQPIDILPLDWANLNAQFIERADGSVVMPVYGCLSEEDTSRRLDCNGMFCSTDGGESWGDFSLIAYDEDQRATAYNEVHIAPVSDRLWVAFLRTEPRGSREDSWMSRAISTDAGHTWSPPEVCFNNSVPHAQILPDGGIAVGASGGVHFTYDLGRTWTRILPLAAYARPLLIDNDTLLVGSAETPGTLECYRRIPAGQGE